MTPIASAIEFAELSEAIRQRAPLIHNITNLVMQNDTADAIAAVGATQITLHTVEESGDAARLCAALALNPGTLNGPWLECARTAIEVASAMRKPWVLDPVGVGLTRYRTDAARGLLEKRPTVLKANASEIMVLAATATSGRGADSIHEVEEARTAAQDLAHEHGCTVVVTGECDLITDGEREVRMSNGRPLMGKMIGSGCMLTSVIACYLAVAEDHAFAAAQAAVAHFTVAGEIAAEQAKGPGTLKPLLLDALFNLDAAQLKQRLRLN